MVNASISPPFTESYLVTLHPTNFNAGGPLEGLSATTADAQPGPGSDLRDNDGAVQPVADGTRVAATVPIPSAGANNLDIDFGLTPNPGVIGDLLYCDNNRNGFAEPGEGAFSVDVHLYRDLNCNQVREPSEPLQASATTNGDGVYRFLNLPVGPDPANPACYVVAVDLTDSSIGSCDNPTTPTTRFPRLDQAQSSSLSNDFGFAPVPVVMSIGNQVFLDESPGGTNNGVFDATETGVAGVQVTLTDPAGQPLTQVTTNPAGEYLFDNVVPGIYRVRIDASNFTAGGPLEGRASSLPTQLDPESDQDQDDNGKNEALPELTGVSTGLVVLSLLAEPFGEPGDPGQADDQNSNLTIDFGFLATVAVGDLVFEDTNGNGRLDLNERGISGVSISVLSSDSTTPILGENGEPLRVQTDGDGVFLVRGLLPGLYVLRVDAQNFAPGGPLEGALSSPITEIDPNQDRDHNDNGLDEADPATNGIFTNPIRLDFDLEPTGDQDSGIADTDTNRTVDFGFTNVPAGEDGLYAIPTLGGLGQTLLLLLLLVLAGRSLRRER